VIIGEVIKRAINVDNLIGLLIAKKNYCAKL